MKKIVLLTCKEMADFVCDDVLLVEELEKRGYAVESTPWEELEDSGQDFFLIRTTWNYTNQFDQFMSCLSKIKDRLWNPYPLVQWNSNKKYLLELYGKGLPVIPLALASDGETLRQCMDRLGGDEFIIKPLIGASAKGLIRFDRKEAPELKEEVIVQRFYPQIYRGEISLFYFAGELVYAVKKVPKQGEIRVQEEYGGRISLYVPSEEEQSQADQIVSNIPGDWLYARVDIVPGVGLIELECIEPALYFSCFEQSAKLLANAIEAQI